MSWCDGVHSRNGTDERNQERFGVGEGGMARWEAQQYKQHSKVRTISRRSLAQRIFTKYEPHARAMKRSTGSIVVLEEWRETLAEDVAALGNSADTQNERLPVEPDLLNPYIDLIGKPSTISRFRMRTSQSRMSLSNGSYGRRSKSKGFRNDREYLASLLDFQPHG